MKKWPAPKAPKKNFGTIFDFDHVVFDHVTKVTHPPPGGGVVTDWFFKIQKVSGPKKVEK